MKPRGISLPAGLGRQLADDMGELVEEVRGRIPRAFESEDYQQRMEAALGDVRSRHRQLTEEMSAEARRRGVGLSMTEAGVAATPLDPDGQPLQPEQFEALPDEQKAEIRKQHDALQAFISGHAGELRRLEKEAAGVRQRVNREVAEFVVEGLFAELREKYGEHSAVLDYLREAQEDMVQNF